MINIRNTNFNCPIKEYLKKYKANKNLQVLMSYQETPLVCFRAQSFMPILPYPVLENPTDISTDMQRSKIKINLAVIFLSKKLRLILSKN